MMIWVSGLKRGTSRRIASAASFLGLLLTIGVPSGAALAAPPEPGNASCMGYEASAVSPPGTSAEAPGGMPGVLADVDEFFVGSGAFANRGAFVRFFVSLEADGHEACDEALVEAVFGGG